MSEPKWTTEEVLAMMADAAQEGLRIGKAGTDGDHTAAGIAYHVWDENGGREK